MRLTDPIADMLARMRNALMVKHSEVTIPYSKIKESIATIFKDEGYIKNYRVVTNGNKKDIIVYLKYNDMNESVIRGLKRISKPGLRVYVKHTEVPQVLNGLGIDILSTSKGIMADKEARQQQVGGEVLAYVW